MKNFSEEITFQLKTNLRLLETKKTQNLLMALEIKKQEHLSLRVIEQTKAS